MNEIGRKIYFDKNNGNIIVDTGEMSENAVETNLEQDIQTYRVLSERNPNTFDFIQLQYGQDSDKFGLYYYHVDINTKQIVWGEPINNNTPPLPTMEDRMETAEDDILNAMEAITEVYEQMLVGGI